MGEGGQVLRRSGRVSLSRCVGLKLLDALLQIYGAIPCGMLGPNEHKEQVPESCKSVNLQVRMSRWTGADVDSRGRHLREQQK